MEKGIQESTQRTLFLELESKVSITLKEKAQLAIDAHSEAIDTLIKELKRGIDDTDPDKRKQAVDSKTAASVAIVKISENMREIVSGWLHDSNQPVEESIGPSKSGEKWLKKGMKDGAV